MFKIIDDLLDGITIYRLVLYVLILLLLVAISLSSFRLLPFNPIPLVLSATLIVIVCWITNTVLAKAFKVQTNFESFLITALILALIITPIRSIADLPFLVLAGILAMTSKYILSINKKHLFNPAALAIFITAILLKNHVSWWIGTGWMMLFVMVGGLLVVRKVRKFSMVITFFLAILIIQVSVLGFIQNIVFETPILFFAFIMLTEPQTTPSNKVFQIIYGGLVGILYLYLTPESALLIGNIFSYLVSPKQKLTLKLKERVQIAPDIYDLLFYLNKKLDFQPGQYMEWTLGHKHSDSRGNRRFFTIAASPTENNLRIGVKFYPNSSSYKKTLLSMNVGDEIVASQLAGDFNMPKDQNKKLVFMAGGIGITPFRSMMQYLIDTQQKRDIVLLFSNKLASDIVYQNVINKAKNLGVKVVYSLTDKEHIPQNWKGRIGYIDANVIQEEVPDFKNRIFYISGPHSMVDTFVKALKGMGIPDSQIKVDFFPGYA